MQATPQTVRSNLAQLSDTQVKELTKLAFFWGMHPVGSYQQRYLLTQHEGTPSFVGLGRLHWDRAPRNARDRSITTPNATTLYGVACFDLSREPAVVVTPKVPDRYFSVQAADQYPRWFFAIGNQFSGREEQTHLVVGPDFDGPYPYEITSANIHVAPSNFALFVVRYALRNNDPDELAAVNALIDRTSITPLSVWNASGRKATRAEDQDVVIGDFATIPRMKELVAIASSLTGIDLLELVSLVLNDRTMTLRKDSAQESATLMRLARLGLRRGVRFDPGWLSKPQRALVEQAFAEAKEESERHVQTSTREMSGHWRLAGSSLAPTPDDYVAQGHYGLKVIGAPIPARSHAGALGFQDSDGKPLSGEHRYTLTFDMDDLPPVSEFWELPIYDSDGYFIDNAIDRYSINSFLLERGGLHVSGNQLTIYIQHDRPSDAQQLQNWLPAPRGAFQFAFRYYGPRGSLLDGTYRMPGVKRVS